MMAVPLVIVEDGNIHQFLEAVFDDEALGCLDILKIDAAKGGAKEGTALMNSSTFSVSTSRSKESMSAKRLKSTALPSITGFEARAPRLPSPRMAVPLEITATRLLRAVIIGGSRVFMDGAHRHSHTGRISQIALRCHRLGGGYFELLPAAAECRGNSGPP